MDTEILIHLRLPSLPATGSDHAQLQQGTGMAQEGQWGFQKHSPGSGSSSGLRHAHPTVEGWRTRGQVKPCRHIPSLCWDVAEVMFTHIALAKTNLMAKRSIHRAGLTLGSCWGREEEIFVGWYYKLSQGRVGMSTPHLTLKVPAASSQFPGALYVLVISTTESKDNNKKSIQYVLAIYVYVCVLFFILTTDLSGRTCYAHTIYEKATDHREKVSSSMSLSPCQR